ncbi:hypothetical protein QFC20_006623 [Naganishia adeliensis]|uniref:Uncharacterized protein n=1 Tax=Naganishia adeliensis TaxID=92952 RepID=A0ACC2VAA7_9TREE|nr:hypothetical protein QFC20_006623 [Naganishia adeliensis]
MMQFKGHNGKLSCRWCTVSGIPYIRTTSAAQPASNNTQNDVDEGDDGGRTGGAMAVVRAHPVENTEEGEAAGEVEGVQDGDPRTGQNQKSKKAKTKTTYYVARRPEDPPINIQDRDIQDIDYTNLPKRTDAQVKANVNEIIRAGDQQEGKREESYGSRNIRSRELALV